MEVNQRRTAHLLAAPEIVIWGLSPKCLENESGNPR